MNDYRPLLQAWDLYLFAEGRHHHPHHFLGAHRREVDGVEGVLFAVWAPNAQRISVVGDFNQWDGRRHPMWRHEGGVWECFIPAVSEGERYKYELLGADDRLCLKSDPYGRRFELRPADASIIEQSHYQWGDEAWLQQRAQNDWLHAPMSIYEVHLGSWKKDEQYHFLDYRRLAEELPAYVKELGFTHIELLPVTEHPLDASWGYQCSGYFAATARFGDPDGLRALIDACHQQGIGVILDWVPAHFPRDEHALARFDGTPLYEHADPKRGEHKDWGTLVFDYGRPEVKAFLIASAIYWLEDFHIDGLRVDAVASMLYLDYSRKDGEWSPNVHGGRENLEAIALLRDLNTLIGAEHPGVLTMAEESTAWPAVSHPVHEGGLGFSMKWNMGWMNDTLDYIHLEPIHRKHHHHRLTFGLTYAFSENFVLPLSHDEVVHLKRSLLEKLPGNRAQQLAGLRLLYLWQYTTPGKKLLFMGAELAQPHEWDWDAPLDWSLLEKPEHCGIHDYLGALNQLYKEHPALHAHDFEACGFQWLNADDADNSVYSFARHGDGRTLVVVLNFTPVVRTGYRLPLPGEGKGRRLLSSAGPDVATEYFEAERVGCHGREWSALVDLPGLVGVVYEFEM